MSKVLEILEKALEQEVHDNDDIQPIEITDECLSQFHLTQNHLDVNTSVFFLRELEYIKRQSKDTKQKKLKGTLLVPISSEAPEWADTFTYRRLTRVGLAKMITDYSHDFPRADVYREEFSVRIKALGSSYAYSKDEIMQSMQTGTRLSKERGLSCKRAVDELQDDIIWNGETDTGIQGFLDYPGITEYTIPNGVGGDTEWSTKTPDEIIADMNAIVTAVIDTTNGVEAPDTMIMPISQFRLISTTRMADGTNTTILKHFLETNGIIKTVDWTVELSGAGASGSDRVMVYPRDSEYVACEIPMIYREEAPQQKGLEFKVIARQKTAGVIIYYPLSCAFADNI